MHSFNLWCFHALPLVYDDSLSYYENLCKVVKYINDLIKEGKIVGDELAKLKQDLMKVDNWIQHYDTEAFEDILRKYFAGLMFVEITDSGYIVYNIPDSLKDITFRTTGLDYDAPGYPEYGRLVLIY